MRQLTLGDRKCKFNTDNSLCKAKRRQKSQHLPVQGYIHKGMQIHKLQLKKSERCLGSILIVVLSNGNHLKKKKSLT